MVDRFDRVVLPACPLQNINEVIAERVRNTSQKIFVPDLLYKPNLGLGA